MASSGHTTRRISLYSVSSTTPLGAGPYAELFVALAEKAPFETRGALGRRIRVNHVEQVGEVWFMELYLMIDSLDVLEVSADPDTADTPNFVVPAEERSFAARTCAIFDLNEKVATIEYVRSGPKSIDFMEVLTEESERITQASGAYLAIDPFIEENFIKEIDDFERIRQVRVIFQRPNPGWGDISILSDELEGSGDARREVVLTAPRTGSIRKDAGLLGYVKRVIRKGVSPAVRVLVSGKRPGEAGETVISSEKAPVKHSASLPITEDEKLYRRQFIGAALPFLSSRSDQEDEE